MTSAHRPFRWDLVRPDQLGDLLTDVEEPDLWFLDELVTCAAKILSRSADGDLYFVGRSLDSVHDLLSGALSGTSWQERPHLLPLSFLGVNGWLGGLDHAETAQLRTNLTAQGLTPARLTQTRPVVLVDIVSTGGTFAHLYGELRRWTSEERASWDVARRKVRFLGVTRRTHTSPNTWRWQQHAPWTAGLPAGAVRNVSLDSAVYSYLADRQHKVTRSFTRWQWADERVTTPLRDTATRQALAEAVALVAAGRARETRTALSRLASAEPAIAEPWLRTLTRELRTARD